MIYGLVLLRLYDEALKVFHDTRNGGVKPEAITFASTSMFTSSALQLGKEVHQYTVDNKLENEEVVPTALFDMHSTTYGSHGNALEAIYLFQQMEKSETIPDRVAFLALLFACSHGGLVNEGRQYFDQMRVRYGIDPTIDHYSCATHLLGRSGRVHGACDILIQMPIKADVGLLGALFSACSQHGKVELDEEVVELLL
ncbi:pentatricopeptide repeat-containing protein At5g27110-like [Nymphaea colorata]|nr:pentatricopeptide repeat-containing protein At5g27110-like [Nymphaea colorata]